MKTHKRSKGDLDKGGKVQKSLKSFVGYLEGTGKAHHTIASYQLDLKDFIKFIDLKNNARELLEITQKDLDRYHDYLKMNGQKTNTRRRKLMTLRKWSQYLSRRKKLTHDIAQSLPAPEKIERIPEVVPYETLLQQTKTMSADSPLKLRNKTLLFLLLETGCAVSEAADLHWSDWNSKQNEIAFRGRSARSFKVSKELAVLIEKLCETKSPEKPLFLGFNRFGSLGGAISTRGIELLVKSLRENSGHSKLTPRQLRHSTIAYWLQNGKTLEQVKTLLGLKTNYAFRVYAPWISAASNAKSTNQKTSNV